MENLTLIFDETPVYIVAQHFFAQHDICFNVKQVIGLTNKDEVSKEYRWVKYKRTSFVCGPMRRRAIVRLAYIVKGDFVKGLPNEDQKRMLL